MRRLIAVAAMALLPAVLSAQTAVRDPTTGDSLSLVGVIPLPDNWWNLKITNAPVHPNSTSLLSGYGNTTSRDFGSNYGFPLVSVSAGYPTVLLSGAHYSSESDMTVPLPIPPEASTQAGWSEELTKTITDNTWGHDRHMLILTQNKDLYELYQIFHNDTAGSVTYGGGGGGSVPADGYWGAQVSYFNMNTNNQRPAGWTSADASGAQIYPGLIKDWDILGSVTAPITHAFRVTFNLTATGWHVFPATHHTQNGGTLPLGTRLRLKASFDISAIADNSCPPQTKRYLQALKDYGLIITDNGTTGQVQGNNSPRWDNDIPYRVNYPVSQYITNCMTYTHFNSDFEIIEYGWGENLEHVVTPGDTYVHYRFGAAKLPFDQSCDVTLQTSGGSTITTNTLSTGGAKRETSFTGLTPSTTYKIVTDCGGWIPEAGYAFPADSFTTTAATSAGNRTIPIAVKPSTVLSTAARVTVDYGTTSAVSDGSVQNTSCTNAGGGCTVNLTLAKGVQYWRVRWQDASNNVLATGQPQSIPVK